jgi:hypothetical protein
VAGVVEPLDKQVVREVMAAEVVALAVQDLVHRALMVVLVLGLTVVAAQEFPQAA